MILWLGSILFLFHLSLGIDFLSHGGLVGKIQCLYSICTEPSKPAAFSVANLCEVLSIFLSINVIFVLLPCLTLWINCWFFHLFEPIQLTFPAFLVDPEACTLTHTASTTGFCGRCLLFLVMTQSVIRNNFGIGKYDSSS